LFLFACAKSGGFFKKSLKKKLFETSILPFIPQAIFPLEQLYNLKFYIPKTRAFRFSSDPRERVSVFVLPQDESGQVTPPDRALP